VFKGDPSPKLETLCSMENGDVINLTSFSMCSHNGTHLDAPSHFIKDGKTIDQIPLFKTVGEAYVCEFDGEITRKDIEKIYEKALSVCEEASKRILIKGKAVLSLQASVFLAEKKIYLFGNESQTVGPEDAPMEVHKVMLGEEIVLLEGIRLGEVSEGVYLLSAAPISIKGAEGSPCRCVLIER
jgi:arylformamidase